jgi:DNA mismatch repair ATPase MutS
MFYLLIISPLIIGVILYFHFQTVRKNRLQNLRRAWGQAKEENFNFDQIARYAMQAGEKGFHRLSKQTLTDIDLNELFSFIDRTNSRIGQQYLYNKVIHPENDREALLVLNERADFFTDQAGLREEIQVELSRLNNNDAYYISSLLREKLLDPPQWLKYAFVTVLVELVLLILSVKFPVLLVWLIFPVSVNMFIHYWNKGNVLQFSRSFPQLNTLIGVSQTISTKNGRFKDAAVEESISALRDFRERSVLLGFSNGGGIKDELSQIATYFIELIKAVFLIELYALFHLVKKLETKTEFILRLFNYVGAIDASLSVASLRAGKLKTCKPQFIPVAKELSAKGIYHPLIRNCVRNDIDIRSKSVLITGSNMSGKTTFLRTVIINSLLAQTLYTCFADEFKSPILKQFSSIRIDDSLLEGKSYYFEEVNVMSSLVDQVKSQDQNVFVLDEVFKGTNTIERVAAAKAVLSYLNRHDNIVIVSTHDIELTNMLQHEYDLYHFTDTIQNNKLLFDHKLKTGQLTTRNAIRILELSNYPAVITDEARQLSRAMDDRALDTPVSFKKSSSI